MLARAQRTCLFIPPQDERVLVCIVHVHVHEAGQLGFQEAPHLDAEHSKGGHTTFTHDTLKIGPDEGAPDVECPDITVGPRKLRKHKEFQEKAKAPFRGAF